MATGTVPALRQDIMTPIERMNAFLTGKPIDRMLCMPIVTSYAAQRAGYTVREYETSGKVMAESHLTVFNDLKYDLVYLFTNCSYIAEAMGQPLDYYDNEPAGCNHPIVLSEQDVSKVHVATADEGPFPVYWEAVDILKKEIGDQVYLSICFSGPLSSAATMRGAESFIRDTYKNPELCHKLLRMCTDTCKNFIQRMVKLGVVPVILEPISSASILSPKMFSKFSQPYCEELIAYAHELGSPIALHICGKTNAIIGKMADTGADIVSFDICDLDIAREKVDGRAVLLGNVTPADVLMFGTREDVVAVCRDSVLHMKDYKPGFVLATGCELPRRIPYEHLEAMLEVIRTYGLFPAEDLE